MKAISDKLEWIGAVTIVLSLLLVAYEIRQNTNAIAAQSVFELNEAANQSLLMESADGEYSRLINLGLENPAALTDEEQLRFRAYVWFALNQYESVWTFYQRGIVSLEELESWRADYCLTISSEGFKYVMQTIPAHASTFGEVSSSWCDSHEIKDN
jgi:hypothetical protein